MDEKIICPICGLECKSDITLKNHVLKMQDDQHIKLAYIYQTLKFKCKEIIPYYQQYNSIFDHDKEYIVNTIQNDVQRKKEEEENKKRAAYEAKKLEQSKIEMERLRLKEELNALTHKRDVQFFQSMPVSDRPKALVNFFYSLINGQCMNYVIEIKLIKDLYLKSHLDTEQIKMVLKYMANMGYSNIRKINYVLNDALLFYEKAKQLDVPNTIPYLVKYYYHSLKMTMNKKLFVKEVLRLESAMRANNLSIEQIKNVLDGMIRRNIRVLMWFDNYVAEYANTQQNINPCITYSNEREINEVINELKEGKMKLVHVNKQIYDSVYKRVVKMYHDGTFSSRYNYLEWAFRVGLELNYDMYTYGKRHNNERSSLFSVAMVQYANNPDVLNKVIAVKQKYDEWLSQKQLMEK